MKSIIVLVLAILVFFAAPGLALQPVPVNVQGRVVASGPVLSMFGIQFSLLYIRSGGMIYTMTCYSNSCRQFTRGTPVTVHGVLWSDFSTEQNKHVLTLDVVSIE